LTKNYVPSCVGPVHFSDLGEVDLYPAACGSLFEGGLLDECAVIPMAPAHYAAFASLYQRLASLMSIRVYIMLDQLVSRCVAQWLLVGYWMRPLDEGSLCGYQVVIPKIATGDDISWIMTRRSTEPSGCPFLSIMSLIEGTVEPLVATFADSGVVPLYNETAFRVPDEFVWDWDELQQGEVPIYSAPTLQSFGPIHDADLIFYPQNSFCTPRPSPIPPAVRLLTDVNAAFFDSSATDSVEKEHAYFEHILDAAGCDINDVNHIGSNADSIDWQMTCLITAATGQGEVQAWRQLSSFVESDMAASGRSSNHIMPKGTGFQRTHQKLFEIHMIEPLHSLLPYANSLDIKGIKFTALDLCSGEGGFAFMLNKLGASKVFVMDSEGKLDQLSGLIATGEVSVIPDKRFDTEVMHNCTPCYTYGLQSSAQIQQVSRIMNYVKANSGGVNLVTCDGYVNTDGYNRENIIQSQFLLFRQQVYCALGSLCAGGTLVIKYMGVGNTDINCNFYSALFVAFKTVTVVKPPSSNPLNDEKYLVCKGFSKELSYKEPMFFINFCEDRSSQLRHSVVRRQYADAEKYHDRPKFLTVRSDDGQGMDNTKRSNICMQFLRMYDTIVLNYKLTYLLAVLKDFRCNTVIRTSHVGCSHVCQRGSRHKAALTEWPPRAVAGAPNVLTRQLKSGSFQACDAGFASLGGPKSRSVRRLKARVKKIRSYTPLFSPPPQP